MAIGLVFTLDSLSAVMTLERRYIAWQELLRLFVSYRLVKRRAFISVLE